MKNIFKSLKEEKYRIKVIELNSGFKIFIPQYREEGILNVWQDLTVKGVITKELADNVINDFKAILNKERENLIKEETYIES